MMTTYTATWNGQTETRNSKRAYTHAAVIRWSNGKEDIVSFHGSEEAARRGSLTKLQRMQGAKVIAAVPLTTPQ